MSPPEEYRDVVRDLLEYLVDHPAAADTAGGIQAWWLRNQYAAATVEAVLEMLSRQRLVETREVKPGIRLYALNDGARQQAVECLEVLRRD